MIRVITTIAKEAIQIIALPLIFDSIELLLDKEKYRRETKMKTTTNDKLGEVLDKMFSEATAKLNELEEECDCEHCDVKDICNNLSKEDFDKMSALNYDKMDDDTQTVAMNFVRNEPSAYAVREFVACIEGAVVSIDMSNIMFDKKVDAYKTLTAVINDIITVAKSDFVITITKK